jgi:hypothetical protein
MRLTSEVQLQLYSSWRQPMPAAAEYQISTARKFVIELHKTERRCRDDGPATSRSSDPSGGSGPHHTQHNRTVDVVLGEAFADNLYTAPASRWTQKILLILVDAIEVRAKAPKPWTGYVRNFKTDADGHG